MRHWWDDSDMERAQYAERNVFRYYLQNYKSYEDWPGTESVSPRSEVSD